VIAARGSDGLPSVTMRRARAGLGVRAAIPAVAALLLAAAPPAGAVSARWAYEQAYDNVAGGDWYRDSSNETATLAWGESYVMMSLASMFRATGDPLYLDRLARHIDGVLARRDDARGVADYRGVSGACWRNTSYQPGGEAYCYAVHSGMIGYPLAEFARLVDRSGLREEPSPDGETYGTKADRYAAAAREVVAYHDDEWDAAGWYFVRPSASFISFAGRDLPLNQSNAMGRLLLALADVTGEAAYLDKASALATRMRAQLTTDAAGAYLWNYWGGAYAAFGEDVSHAGINVGFAAMAADRRVVFDSADADAFAATFTEHVYIDDATFSDFVGGGSVNDSSYRPQIGRWGLLTPARTAVYTAIRDAFDRDYPPDGIGSGSVLLGWAYLAEFEPPLCAHFFYSVDWETRADHRIATAYGANVLTVPPDFSRPCMIPLEVDVPRTTRVEQWDGTAYHRVATWQPTGGFVPRRIPYEPRWPFEYWSGGVLFQFADAFVAGAGIRVREPRTLVPPTIVSTPPSAGALGLPVVYEPAGAGDAPFWWSLVVRPRGARVAAATGSLSWIPDAPGDFSFTLRLENDVGAAEQSFVVRVPAGADGDAGDADGGPDGADDGAGWDDAVPVDNGADADVADARPDAEPAGDGGGCSCRAFGGGSAGGSFFVSLLAAAWLVARRDGKRTRDGVAAAGAARYRGGEREEGDG
jgi:hypothetical protein